jgi:hypothetical protein
MEHDMHKSLKTLLLAGALAGSVGAAAQAAPFTGSFWNAPANTLATIGDAITYATITDPTADATFTTSVINYGDASKNWLIGTLSNFLNGNASNLSSNGGTNFQESVILITGVATFVNGQQYKVTSDDGFRLTVNNSVLSEFTGIRAPNNSTPAIWTGATGNYAFSLWYFEGQRTQAQLQANLVPVPLPAGGLLLLGGLAGLAALGRRKATAA